MTSPRLSALHSYPVKSVQGPTLGEATVEPWGIAGDRRYLVVDGAGRAITQREFPRMTLVHARPLGDGGIRLSAPGMDPLTVAVPEPVGTTGVRLFNDSIEAVVAARSAGEWFSRFLGARLRLVHMDDPARRRPLRASPNARPGETVSFADGHPLLLTTTASLDALNAAVARGDHPQEGPLPMNRFRPNVVISGTQPWAEDDWGRVRIGEVVFRVSKPSARCVVTTTDQATGERGREPLRTLAAGRRFGDGLLFGQNLVPESRGTLRLGDSLQVMDRQFRPEHSG